MPYFNLTPVEFRYQTSSEDTANPASVKRRRGYHPGEDSLQLVPREAQTPARSGNYLFFRVRMVQSDAKTQFYTGKRSDSARGRGWGEVGVRCREQGSDAFEETPCKGYDRGVSVGPGGGGSSRQAQRPSHNSAQTAGNRPGPRFREFGALHRRAGRGWKGRGNVWPSRRTCGKYGSRREYAIN